MRNQNGKIETAMPDTTTQVICETGQWIVHVVQNSLSICVEGLFIGKDIGKNKSVLVVSWIKKLGCVHIHTLSLYLTQI